MVPPGADPEHQICLIAGAREGQQSIPGLQYAEAKGLLLSHKWRNVGILFAFIAAYAIISMIGSEVMRFTAQGGSPVVYVKKDRGQSGSQFNTGQTLEKDAERQLPSEEAKIRPARHSGPSLTWENLTVDIGEKRIVKGITAYIRPGDFVSICGASGAGKTTMLKALSQINVTGDVDGELLFGNKPPGRSFKKVTGWCCPHLMRNSHGLKTIFTDIFFFQDLHNRLIFMMAQQPFAKHWNFLLSYASRVSTHVLKGWRT